MKCNICNKREGSKGSVINGIYYRSICEPCYERAVSGQHVSSGFADYERGRDTEEHEADIMQPYGRDGQPDADFIRLYPDTAKKMFTPDEIEKAYRN